MWRCWQPGTHQERSNGREVRKSLGGGRLNGAKAKYIPREHFIGETAAGSKEEVGTRRNQACVV